VQPVDHFEILIKIHALDRGHPGLENLQTADRAVLAALPRRLQPRFPGRADTADKHQPGVAGRRHVDGDFALANFAFSNHVLIQMS
jgi:hypothetical protein